MHGRQAIESYFKIMETIQVLELDNNNITDESFKTTRLLWSTKLWRRDYPYRDQQGSLILKRFAKTYGRIDLLSYLF